MPGFATPPLPTVAHGRNGVFSVFYRLFGVLDGFCQGVFEHGSIHGGGGVYKQSQTGYKTSKTSRNAHSATAICVVHFGFRKTVNFMVFTDPYLGKS